MPAAPPPFSSLAVHDPPAVGGSCSVVAVTTPRLVRSPFFPCCVRSPFTAGPSVRGRPRTRPCAILLESGRPCFVAAAPTPPWPAEFPAPPSPLSPSRHGCVSLVWRGEQSPPCNTPHSKTPKPTGRRRPRRRAVTRRVLLHDGGEEQRTGKKPWPRPIEVEGRQ